MAAHTFVSGLIVAVLLLSQVIRVIFTFSSGKEEFVKFGLSFLQFSNITPKPPV
jgi:hypothetical protein